MPPGRLAVEDIATLQNAAVATGSGSSLDVEGFASVLVQFTGSSPVGTITFEGSIDGTNFVSVPVSNIATGAVATTTTTVGIFSAGVAGLRTFRARISAYTSGTFTVVAQGSLASAISSTAPGTTLGTANQGTANGAGTSSWPVQGASASGATKAGNPVQSGLVFNTTQPTVTTGQTVESQATARGAAIVATGVDNFAVDTELPAAAALADTATNPTTPLIGAAAMGFGGTTWTRLYTINQFADGAALGSSIGVAANWIFNGTNWDRKRSADSSPTSGLGVQDVASGTGTITSLSALATGAGTALDCGVARTTATVHVRSSAGVSAGVVKLEGSLDNSTWFAIDSVTTSAANTDYWLSTKPGAANTPTAFRYFRADITTNITGGTVTAKLAAAA